MCLVLVVVGCAAILYCLVVVFSVGLYFGIVCVVLLIFCELV